MYGYLFLGGFFVAALGGFAWAKSDWAYDNDTDIFGFFLSLVGTILLVIGLVNIPICRANVEAEIAAHYELGRTLEAARQNEESLGDFELATLQREVVESNASLAKAKVGYKYWRPYMPAIILDVEPIK